MSEGRAQGAMGSEAAQQGLGRETSRRLRWSGRLLFTIALLGLAVGLLVSTMGLGSPARRVPFLVIAPVVVLIGVQLARELSTSDPKRHRVPRQWLALAWMTALPMLIYLAGFYAGSGLFTMAFVRLRGRDTWGAAIGLATGVTVVVWLLVGVLLSLTGPTGALWELLLR